MGDDLFLFLRQSACGVGELRLRVGSSARGECGPRQDRGGQNAGSLPCGGRFALLRDGRMCILSRLALGGGRQAMCVVAPPCERDGGSVGGGRTPGACSCPGGKRRGGVPVCRAVSGRTCTERGARLRPAMGEALLPSPGALLRPPGAGRVWCLGPGSCATHLRHTRARTAHSTRTGPPAAPFGFVPSAPLFSGSATRSFADSRVFLRPFGGWGCDPRPSPSWLPFSWG